jgi:hypothetical protein
VSSRISGSLRLDCSSIFPVSSFHQTRTRVSSCFDCINSIFFSSRNVFREIRGVTISDLRELIYFSLSKRFHLLARFSAFSSFMMSCTISEKLRDNNSNPWLKTEKSIFDSNSDCIFLLCSSIVGVSFWIFSQRLSNIYIGLMFSTSCRAIYPKI